MQADSDFDPPPNRKKTNLAPLQRHPGYFTDPYKNSFLMTYNLRKKKDQKLREIM
jgi:hypothetical protein